MQNELHVSLNIRNVYSQEATDISIAHQDGSFIDSQSYAVAGTQRIYSSNVYRTMVFHSMPLANPPCRIQFSHFTNRL